MYGYQSVCSYFCEQKFVSNMGIIQYVREQYVYNIISSSQKMFAPAGPRMYILQKHFHYGSGKKTHRNIQSCK